MLVGQIAMIAITGAFLAACQTPTEIAGQKSIKSSFLTTDRYPIRVEKGEVRLKIPTVSGALFSDDRAHEVRKFVDDFRSSGNGRLTISTPSGGGNNANAVAGKVGRIASHYGIPAYAISYRNHSGSRQAPVIVSYRRYFAVTKKCGNWPTSMATAFENNPYHNLGCAHQHNIAAMAANPRDLVTPRSSGLADAQRYDDVLDRWNTGQSTASDRSDDEKGSVSDIE